MSTGGGGYAVLNVVPRAWTHLLGIVSGQPVDRETPGSGGVAGRDGRVARRRTMTDGADASYVPFEDGFTPESRVDQAILATRRAVFPELGLDPEL